MPEQLSAIDVLTQRVSCNMLSEPAPSPKQLDIIQRAALRAADHKLLRPWRFLVIEGDGLESLGKLFLRAKRRTDPGLSEDAAMKTLAMPRRAPMIIVAIASHQPNPKVPEIEQLLSTGAAVQNMLNAVFALGLGAIWRTGDLAENAEVKAGLGLSGNETIVGFLYLGTPKSGLREAPSLELGDYFKAWP